MMLGSGPSRELRSDVGGVCVRSRDRRVFGVKGDGADKFKTCQIFGSITCQCKALTDELVKRIARHNYLKLCTYYAKYKEIIMLIMVHTLEISAFTDSDLQI